MNKVALISIFAMLGACVVAAYVYDEIRKEFGDSHAGRYVAWASLTAAPVYAMVIYDIFVHNLGRGTVNRSIGFVLWAVLFVTAAFAFGKFADKKNGGN